MEHALGIRACSTMNDDELPAPSGDALIARAQVIFGGKHGCFQLIFRNIGPAGRQLIFGEFYEFLKYAFIDAIQIHRSNPPFFSALFCRILAKR
jgi:hypothetical protein